jgi:serine protease
MRLFDGLLYPIQSLSLRNKKEKSMLPKRIWSFLCFICAVVILSAMGLVGCDTSGGGGGSSSTSTYMISGTLTVGQGLALDGDTQDGNNPTTNNDSTPQEVSIPVSVGGYGDSEDDPVDLYEVEIEQASTIVLSVGDPETNDLNLYLEEQDGTVIGSSTGTGSFEIIEAEDPGERKTFHVRVRAVSGGCNYVLSIGVSTASSASLTPLVQDGQGPMFNAEFVADEIILRPKGQAGSLGAQTILSSMTEYFGLVQKSVSPTGAVLVKLDDVQNSPYMLQRASQTSSTPAGQLLPLSEEETRIQTLEMIRILRSHPGIDYAEPNYIYYATAIPDDPFYKYQWHYTLIDLPQAWEITTGTDTVVVAVVDTGVVTDHPDLADRILKDGGSVVGYDFITDSESARDGDGIDPDPKDEGDLLRGSSSSFHGSHVAGTIAATSNNASHVAGVTWQGKIMPLRALGLGGSGTVYDIAQCILYAAGLTNASNTVPSVKADVINLSLGPSNDECQALPPISTVYKNAVEAALSAGVIVVAAAGNDNCDVPAPLSEISGVINVSAVDAASQRAPYSNYGTTIDVAAPGGDTSADLNGDAVSDGVFSTVADDSSLPWQYGIVAMQGTSMATPHMAGVVALMLSVNPTLTPNDINQLLAGTHSDANADSITWDLGDSGRDDIYGYGLINAHQAVIVASSIAGGQGYTPPENTPILSVFPNPLQFSTTTESLELSLDNTGTADLQITAISDDVAWLSIEAATLPLTIKEDDTATVLTVSVDRSGLVDGTYLGVISIASNGGDASISVSMQVQSSSGGDVGQVYVLVVESATNQSVSQATVGFSDAYSFQTPQDIPAGTYFVVAGTDRNNDGYICDSGEACGLYPLIDNPTHFDLNGNVTGIDFSVDYIFFTSQTTARVNAALGRSDGNGFRRLDLPDIKEYGKLKGD